MAGRVRKVVVATGGARGIEFAVVRLFLANRVLAQRALAKQREATQSRNPTVGCLSRAVDRAQCCRSSHVVVDADRFVYSLLCGQWPTPWPEPPAFTVRLR